MKYVKLIFLLLLPTMLFAQTNVQKTQGTNVISNGPIVIGSGTTLSTSGTGGIVTNNAVITGGSIATSALTANSITITAGTGLSGGGTVTLGGSTTLTNAGVINLAGTTGITANASTGSVSLSLGAITPTSVSTGALTATGTTTLATSLSGVLKGTSGVVSTATANSDYLPATTGNSSQLLGSTGSGGLSNVSVGSGLTYSGGVLSASGGGTVTTVTTNNQSGIITSVSNPTTTPNISLSLGNITPNSIVTNNISGNAVTGNSYNGIVTALPAIYFGLSSAITSGFTGGSQYIASDSLGNFYVCGRSYSPYVVKITPQGVATTFASTVTSGSAYGIACDSSNNVYVGIGSTITKISSSGTVTNSWATGLYSGGAYLIADASNNLYSINITFGSVCKITSSAVVSNFWATGSSINPSVQAVFDSSGNMYVTSSGNILKIPSTGGSASTWATLSSGSGSNITIDSSNNIYAVVQGSPNSYQVKISPSGSVNSTWAQLKNPSFNANRIATSSNGTSYIANITGDTSLFSISQVSPTGSVVNNYFNIAGDAYSGTYIYDIWVNNLGQVLMINNSNNNIQVVLLSNTINDGQPNAIPVSAGGTSAATVAAANQNLTPPTNKVTISSGAATIDWTLSNSFLINPLNANTTMSFTGSIDAQVITVIIQQSASYTVTWPSNVKWAGGTAPTQTTGSGKADVYRFVYSNSYNEYFGSVVQNYTP